ncbi:glycosyltransferase [Stenomitos frigidus]|uniref:Group 1 glycosyl transferase n=1 Tax=Stenomitos frigidus ULC18 TaxID=2107698 RepID=A0A2T1E2R6_9CYAN|nr:glycosyltransferase [Stenomitos frigidus]PSB27033.1 group 1 glycosyl transferase [Stenomitos frigidus ULC18]
MANLARPQLDGSVGSIGLAKDPSALETSKKGMLLVLPVPFRSVDGQLFFEAQACNGLEQWADNFGFVTVAALLMPEALVAEEKTIVWRSTATLTDPQRFEFVPLPWAYSTPIFLKHYRSTKALLEQLIERSCYLQFCIGGLVGDWGAVAAIAAHQQKRPYAIHADWVEHKHILQVARDKTLPKRLKALVFSFLIEKYNAWVIRRASLGLWHGADCYTDYSPLCGNSFLIHDIHTNAEDVITPAAIAEKVSHVTSEQSIRLCYAGRMEPMKAPLDWIKAIERAHRSGVDLKAVWIGAGSLFDEMQRLIAERDLGAVIELVGFESDRDKLLKQIRDSHLMLFTHITSESPRCLIESLISGTPIIGYHSDYADELVKEFGGGEFVPKGQWEPLGDLLATLSRDRSRLARLIQQAGESGKRFNSEAVFRERSDLMKAHLV